MKIPKQSSQPQKDTSQQDLVQTESAALRKKAEELLRTKRFSSPQELEKLPPEEIQQKLHELQIYQIELEMQNDELRQAHLATHAAKDHYFKFYDLAPVGYCTLNEAGLIIEVNLTLANFLGIPRNALLKGPINSYIFKEDQDTYYLHRKQLLNSLEPQVCELRMMGKNNTPFWARLDTNVLQETDGTYILRIVLTNITERKLLEEEKNKIEAQYLQAQKLESVGRLAGGVAHDFNNKLTIILGLTDLIMAESGPTSPILDDLKEIRLAALHSADLTRQLLAFARKQLILPQYINLNETVDGMLKMLRRLIGEHIDLVWLPKTGLWSVKIDPSQIDQILANLCVNARDAIAGVGRLTISTDNIVLDESYCANHLDCQPGEYVVLTISDNGCGIDKKVLDFIFEPFFTTKEIGKGTGLGLATVYGAIKQNHGFIDVSSEKGIGTSFKIYLPRQMEETTQISVQSSFKTNITCSETILLVEDEKALLKITTRLLQEIGYHVLAADTPGAALHLTKEFAGKIDLVLTDMIMSEMTGRELVQKLLPVYPQLKILFMSGYTFNEIDQQDHIVVKEHFLQKPFSKNQLARKVREVLTSAAA